MKGKDTMNQNVKANVNTSQQKGSWSESEENWGNDDWGSVENSLTDTFPDKNNTYLSDSKYNTETKDFSATSFTDQHHGDSLVVVGSAKSNVSTKSHTQKYQRATTDLGSEFDIKSINVTKKQTSDSTNSLDFFCRYGTCDKNTVCEGSNECCHERRGV